CFFFFFQAEDGIRDLIVTGVQTCALPICKTKAEAHRRHRRESSFHPDPSWRVHLLLFHSQWSAKMWEALADAAGHASKCRSSFRSEERRVGKECETRRGGFDEKREKTSVK